MAITEAELLARLRTLVDPNTGRDFVAGKAVKKDADMAVVESVKAASDVYAPVTGEVTEANTAIVEEPAKVNEDPEGAGWFVKIKLSDKGQLSGLMDKAAYDAFCATQ